MGEIRVREGGREEGERDGGRVSLLVGKYYTKVIWQ